MGNSFLMFLLSFKKVLSPKNAKAKIKSLKILNMKKQVNPVQTKTTTPLTKQNNNYTYITKFHREN